MVQPCPKTAIRKTDKKPSETSKPKKKGLFLRIPSKDFQAFDKINNLLSIFEGSLPVYFYFEDTKEYSRPQISKTTDGNISLIRELKKILGESNVVLQ